MQTHQGLAASPGIASGSLWFFRPTQPDIDTQPIAKEQAADEQQRFHAAREKVDAYLAQVFARVLAEQGEEEAEIFASHRELLDDEELIGDIEALIADDCVSATAAVKQYLDEAAETMRALDDPYLRERAAEFLDIQNNLLLALNDLPFASLVDVPNDSIIVAEDLSPSQTAQLDINHVRGFVLEKGGLTSHVAILARNIGLPAVMGVKQVMESAQDGDRALIDGATGTYIVAPDAGTSKYYQALADEQHRREAQYAKLYGKPAITTDGKHFALFSNIGSDANLHLVEDNGSEGIGLFRSEFLFMEAASAPDEEAQYQVYRKAIEHLDGQPVILRLLDIGGDKPLSYMDFQDEDNPFLGWRGVRLYADNREIFHSQIRAALRAGVHGNLRIMIPMVDNVGEIHFVKQAIAEQRSALEKAGVAVAQALPVGIMVETPAAALIAKQLARHADFFSIGTNDLTQYTLAVDRGNTRIASLYDSLHPAVLRLMDETCRAGQAAGIEVGVCGEMGGQLEATPLLVGMGLDELSISGLGLPAVKYAINQLSYKECRALLDQALECEDSAAVRALVEPFIN
ncbi:phosphoenolpyruvate--protein phosphotransferase [Suttonella sp. R2A3]|uniref:phosphoenolpyruvate--protein phosphotransferase n=1 Tax=Suttonella sp. R2A3 TaxID=2908648 RepID=UPI001F263EFC|nr:phosphoenolpyruvate--protein phosphotransferase [Suttonella sp. R2A3]UJF24014.1 phosphoenolpyruvate--protein phosphotransferase [Suttonella sp. R2A3]